MSDVKANMVNTVGQPVPPAKTRLSVIRKATMDTLHALTAAELKDPTTVESRVLESVHHELDLENALRKTAHQDTWKHINELMPSQIADIIVYSYPVCRIAGAGKNIDEDQDLIAMYQYHGEAEGTYVTSNVMFRQLMREYNYALTSRQAEEVMQAMMEQLPRVTVCKDRNLVAVNNGIFDYDTKTLLPFDPGYVFLTKSSVNYNPNAVNPVIHNDDDGTDWDVESWMKTLSDDDEIVNLLWEIIGAIIRPLVPWNKSAWFYSETGNNGKGTLCELMRQIVGEGTYASIPLSEFSKDFMLEPLLHSSAIIVDENDVGTYIEKAGNLKAVITGDALSINRKYKAPVAFQFKGFMVQCLNEMPRIRDKSDSFYRRQLFIPFTKCFTGQERKYIKADYLHRKDVLEYVLWRVLNMDYYTLSEPEACKHALDEYKDFVDTTRSFLQEIMPKLQWTLVPFDFLYDIYKVWYRDTVGNDHNQKSKQGFVKDVKSIVVSSYPEWEVCMNPMKPASNMDAAEPLIYEYHLDKWKNPSYRGTDIEKMCHPALSTSYRGIRKTGLPYSMRNKVSTDDA